MRVPSHLPGAQTEVVDPPSVPAVNGREPGRTLLLRCFSHDYTCLANKASPLAFDLLGLADHIHARHEHEGIGVIGMCLTGNFPLVLARRSYVHAIVMSQPSLPIAVGPLVRRVGLPAADLQRVHTPAYTTGYDNDCISPAARRHQAGTPSNTGPGRTRREVPRTPRSLLTDSPDQPAAKIQLERITTFLHHELDHTD
jgi:hypothetical protein